MDLCFLILGPLLFAYMVKECSGQPLCEFEFAYTIERNATCNTTLYTNATVDIGGQRCLFSLHTTGPLSCPNDVIRLASADAAWVPVSWTLPDIMCQMDLLSSHQPGDLFPTNATTTVWYWAFGGDSCNFTVTVEYPDCPSDMVLPLSEARLGVNWTDPTLAEGYTSVANPSMAPLESPGLTTISYTFSQANFSGPMQCSPDAVCSFNVIVYDESKAPEILDCPKDVVVEAEKPEDTPNYNAPRTRNESLGDILMSPNSEGSSFQYKKGVNTLTFTYLNKYSNLSATCRFTVTVNCEEESNITLVIVAAVGYCLWGITLLIVCAFSLCKCLSCCSGGRGKIPEAPTSPPPSQPPPKRVDPANGSDGVYGGQTKTQSEPYASGAYDNPARVGNPGKPDEWADSASESECGESEPGAEESTSTQHLPANSNGSRISYLAENLQAQLARSFPLLEAPSFHSTTAGLPDVTEEVADTYDDVDQTV